jgi:hypothetical protein
MRDEAEALAREALGISVQQLGVHSAFVADGMKLLAQVLLQGHPVHRLSIGQSPTPVTATATAAAGASGATATAGTTPVVATTTTGSADSTAVNASTPLTPPTPPPHHDQATIDILHADAASEAVRLFEHALAIYQRVKGETDLACADVLLNMSNFYFNQAKALASSMAKQAPLPVPLPLSPQLDGNGNGDASASANPPPHSNSHAPHTTAALRLHSLQQAAEAAHRAELIYAAHRHPLTRTAAMRRQEIEGVEKGVSGRVSGGVVEG